MGYMVGSTYLNRRKQIRSRAKADAQTSGLMGDWGSKNVTFRNEPRSLCLRILSPSTWTRTRQVQMIPLAPALQQRNPIIQPVSVVLRGRMDMDQTHQSFRITMWKGFFSP